MRKKLRGGMDLCSVRSEETKNIMNLLTSHIKFRQNYYVCEVQTRKQNYVLRARKRTIGNTNTVELRFYSLKCVIEGIGLVFKALIWED